MGSTINTKGNEIGPFLAADGRTLYFSSSGHPGYGSTDIFVSKRIGAGWTNWTKPANLGSEINSPGWEGYFSMDLFGEYAYLAANLGNGNGVDIYQIKLKEKETVVVTKDDHNETKKVLEDEVVIDENPKEEEKKPEEETLEITPNPVVIISGIVYDATTNLPLGASINYEDLDSHEQTGIASSDPNTGRYKIVLPFGLHYGFHAEAKLHYPVHENIDIKGAGKRVIEIERDLYLVPLEVGKAIRLNNVFFERGKPILLPSSYPELSRLVTLLKENPSIEIRLEGHTDNVGNPVELMKLSWDRVKAVAQYLSKQGISKNRITDKGYGRSKPAYPNDSEAHKAKNRRVEFVITKL